LCFPRSQSRDPGHPGLTLERDSQDLGSQPVRIWASGSVQFGEDGGLRIVLSQVYPKSRSGSFDSATLRSGGHPGLTLESDSQGLATSQEKQQGLKPNVEREAFAARVNSCPVTKLQRTGHFHQAVKSYPDTWCPLAGIFPQPVETGAATGLEAGGTTGQEPGATRLESALLLRIPALP
jgi:hypothetical protein